MFSRLGHLRAHKRLVVSAVTGAVAALVVPGVESGLARGLVGWNVGVWLYLTLICWTMFRGGPQRLQQAAQAQAESAFAVLMLVMAAAVVSIVAVVLELSAAKAGGSPGAPHDARLHALGALVTVVGSWLLLPTLSALNYASRYHAEPEGAGLEFPGADEQFVPDFGDFLYVAFTIAVASQTSDVAISSREMRRLALLQSLVSFAFNTTIVAFTVNIAASRI